MAEVGQFKPELKFTEYEENLAKDWVLQADYSRMGKKTTVCLLTLKNGFEVVGTSACVDPNTFDYDIGCFYAQREALNKLDELIGFYRQAEGFRSPQVTVKVDANDELVKHIADRIWEKVSTSSLSLHPPLGAWRP